eukprot:CAMPEP_0197598114 /NCGR_PEP_ID=MMETSP1326-20131121/28671_1 /TAXON_ID=1155430 /ORGANISM="Genus nov. species nov., Strain RCC2288" /LENGTH=35 /DNA_ID= /DNA_START= /DNA_END= /DNA_ORIENTATION=
MNDCDAAEDDAASEDSEDAAIAFEGDEDDEPLSSA